MSSLIPSGSASGTGSMTLAAPVTNSNQTATLPDATGTVMVSGNMPAFSAYATSAQSISNGSFAKVTFDTESFDTNNNFSSSRFTPTIAGYYQLSFNLKVNCTVSQTRFIGTIYKNGSTIGRQFDLPTTFNAGISPFLTGTALVSANGSTDYFEVYVYVEGTGTLTTGAVDANTNYFSGVLARTS